MNINSLRLSLLPVVIVVAGLPTHALAQQAASADGPRVAPAAHETSPNTPRGGVLSGGYIAVDLGLVAIDQAVRNKVGLGLGPAFQLRLGAELWDQWILGFAAGVYAPSDKRPTSEIVVTCTRVEGQEVGCDPPARQESGVTGGMLSFESGYQRRFRPWLSSSFAPGALLGYTVMPKPPKRGVGCEGCAAALPLDVHVAGLYVAPFFRVTIGKDGNYALVARSQIYLSGDFSHLTTLGGEFGLP